MNQAIVLTHAPCEGPGRIATLLVDRGYRLDVRELHRGDVVPGRMSPDDVLVVMGGPMGVADRDQPEVAFLRAELELLAVRVGQDAPVLGICLGAQLLAHAAGAQVRPMTRSGGERCYEVGWAPVRFHRRGDDDAILRGVPMEAHVLHWHGDMFELPAGARLLASTEICAHQGFQLGARGFGLQFHCEVTTEHVEDFVRTDGDYIVQANGPGGAERIRRDTRDHLAAAQAVGDRLLGNMLTAMAARPR